MLKRRKGYTLLLLLVLTGLAGRLSTTTITSRERRLLIDELKESKAAVLQTVKGLSEEQLNFRPAKAKWSIKECMHHIIFAENYLWHTAEAALKKPTSSVKKPGIKINDQQLLNILPGKENLLVPEHFNAVMPEWRTAEETLDAFKTKRSELIKYVKTSTDDMRNHLIEKPIGFIDAYQVLLYIPPYTKRITRQIEEIKADPSFPK
jgi:hypothetical protein